MVQPADKDTTTKLHNIAHEIVQSELEVVKGEHCPADPVEMGMIIGMQMAMQYPEWAVGFLQSLEAWPLDETEQASITRLVTALAVSGVSDD